MLSPFWFVVLSLSVWRFTHLVVEDQLPLVAKPRQWVVDRKPDGSVAYLVNCFWCSSVWVAAAHIGALYLLTDSVPGPVFLAAAWSGLAAAYETLVEAVDAYALKAGS